MGEPKVVTDRAVRGHLAAIYPRHQILRDHVTEPTLVGTQGRIQNAALELHSADHHAVNVPVRQHVQELAALPDVEPILAKARLNANGAIDPIAAYRAAGYRQKVAAIRPAVAAGGGGIV